MDQNFKKIGLINLIVYFVLGAAGIILARYANSLSGQAGMIFFAIGFLVMAVSYVQMRLEENERLEKMEFEELKKGSESSLFGATEADIFPAQRSREQFERFFVPGFTILLFLLEAAGTYFLWRWLDLAIAPAVQNPVVVLAWFGVFFLVLFLLGKYSTNLSQLEGQRLLRPGASYLVFGAYGCAIIAACIGFGWGGYADVDKYVARAFAVILGLLALEELITLVLEIYRPRVKGKEERVLYQSRLVALLAQPEGLVTTAAQALDYQFGFKVSETWFYRFLERSLGWLILLQLLVLFLSTCFVFVEPGEEGLLERFGRPIATEAPLLPGLHLKFPWPIDKVYSYQTRRIQQFNIGFEHGETGEPETTVVWTVPHYKEEFNMLVAIPPYRSLTMTNQAPGEKGVPVDMISVSVPVQFQIKNLHDWAYHHTDAAELLRMIGTREVVRYLVSVDLFQLMSSGRSEAAQELKKRIQEAADQSELGVEIVFVGLQDIHPPVKVAGSFESVVGAFQETNAMMQAASGDAARMRLLAQAEAKKTVHQAEAYRQEVIQGTRAQAARFQQQAQGYEVSPLVFMQRAYLEALQQGATNARKYILAATNTQDVLQFDLQDKVRADLSDRLAVPPARK